MDHSDWLFTKDIAEKLKDCRDNDIRVLVNNNLVPIKLLYYHRIADMWVFELDENSDGYQHAVESIVEAAGVPDAQ